MRSPVDFVKVARKVDLVVLKYRQPGEPGCALAPPLDPLVAVPFKPETEHRDTNRNNKGQVGKQGL